MSPTSSSWEPTRKMKERKSQYSLRVFSSSLEISVKDFILQKIRKESLQFWQKKTTITRHFNERNLPNSSSTEQTVKLFPSVANGFVGRKIRTSGESVTSLVHVCFNTFPKLVIDDSFNTNEETIYLLDPLGYTQCRRSLTYTIMHWAPVPMYIICRRQPT